MSGDGTKSAGEEDEEDEDGAEDGIEQEIRAAERRKWQDIRKGMQDRSADHESFFAVCRSLALFLSFVLLSSLLKLYLFYILFTGIVSKHGLIYDNCK